MRDPQQRPTPHARLAQSWRRYLRFWGTRADADVDDELQFHIDMRVRDAMGRGLTEAEARAAVASRLGDVGRARAECVTITQRRERRMTRTHVVDAARHDLRFALRGFVRQKGWTAVALITLALGIGANTAVFSVVNTLVLNPLPYPDADRVALLFLKPSQPSETGVRVTITPQQSVIREWQHARSFEAVEAYSRTDVTFIHRDDTPATLAAAHVGPGFARFAGAPVLAGRMFSETDVASRAPVLLLGEQAWRTRFGADPTVVGRTVSVNDADYTIVGVLSARAQLPWLGRATTDLWLPLDLGPNSRAASVMGRLRPGVSAAGATAELDTLMARVAGATGAGSVRRFQAEIRRPQDLIGYKQSLLVLMGAVGLVLLIACANVAHLLLARATSRQRELAVRVALGAGRGRMLRQLLTENLVLTLTGCLGGVIVAAGAVRALKVWRPESLEALGATRLDAAALLAAVGLAVLTGLAFGIMTTVQASRHAGPDALRSGSRESPSARQRRVRGLLVVTEMALSTTLLVGAALLVRSVIHLHTAETGFDPAGLFAVEPTLPESRYATDAAKRAFHDALLERTRQIPGVVEITRAGSVPPGFSFLIGALQVEGQPSPAPGQTNLIRFNAVSPSYFRTMRMALLDGRTFVDTTDASTEVIVNQGFARKHWAGRSAIGKRINQIGYDGRDKWLTVVGVVADASTGGLTHDRADPILYLPAGVESAVLVRAAPNASILPAMRAAVTALDPRLPPPTIVSVESAMRDSAAAPRFTTLLLVGFTVVALVLAAVGLYGVMAYGVAQRTREIGIRMALGATRGAVATGVVRHGILMAILGIASGLAGAWWATQLIEKMLYGVNRTDPLAFAAGAAVLLGTAILACLVPMNRAASVDPAIAMRAD